MVRYRRNRQPGGTYFLTVTLNDRRSNLLVEEIDRLRVAVAREKSCHPFHIDAMVVLPDHWHALITLPAGDFDYMGRMRRIKAGFTRSLLRDGVVVPRVNEEAALWQRRYWEHTVRDEEDFRRHVDYIHYNPVKHGCAVVPAEWPYSSIHRYIKEGSIEPDWGCACIDPVGDFGE